MKILLVLAFGFMSLAAFAQKDINFYSNRAEERINTKEYAAALEDFKTVLTMAQKTGDKNAIANAYNRRSVVYSFMRDYKNAIAELENAIKVDPKNANAYFDGMASYAKDGLKDYALSLNYLNKAIAFCKENNLPEDGIIYYYRGKLKIEKLEKQAEGCEDLKKAIKMLSISNPALVSQPQKFLDKYCK